MKLSHRLPAWLWQTSYGLRTQAILNASIGITTVLLDFAFIYSTKRVVDIATGRCAHDLQDASLCLVVIVSLRVMVAFAARWVGALLGIRSQNRLQLRIFSHLMRSRFFGMEQLHSGDVLNRLERDVADLTSTITETIPAALAVCVRLAGAFTMLYAMDNRLAFVLIGISPVFALLSKVYIRRMRAITREVRSTDSRIQSLLQESLQHRIVLKTLGRTETVTDKLRDTQDILRRQILRRTVFSSTSATLLNIGFNLGYLVTFLWGAARLHDGTITYGTMLAFIQLVGQIQSPIRDMSRFIPSIVGSLTAGERLLELEDTPLEEEGSPILFGNGAGVRIKDVWYSYKTDSDTGRQVLKGLSYDFTPGSITAILGETGAGKTTLIRLILALLQPESGTVELYDNTRQTAVSPLTRPNLIYVPQGNTLLSGTIRDNLLLGDPFATAEDMEKALHTACADFVFEFPAGLDTICGEHGTGLSEGQSQRIAIARALLSKGCILLLDEATSALDPDTERQLLHNLQKSPEWRQTVICVTHRPAIVEYCTQVLRLEKNPKQQAQEQRQPATPL